MTARLHPIDSVWNALPRLVRETAKSVGKVVQLEMVGQDTEVDREIGVHSVPARYGVPFALHLSSAVHVVTFGLFVWFGQLVGLGWLWWIGLLVTAAAFIYEHAIVRPGDLSRVNRAFFTANGFVGITLFVFALLDLVVRAGLRP